MSYSRILDTLVKISGFDHRFHQRSAAGRSGSAGGTQVSIPWSPALLPVHPRARALGGTDHGKNYRNRKAQSVLNALRHLICNHGLCVRVGFS